MTITDIAISAIKGNNRAIAKLMIEFDRGQPTIENWMNSKDKRLTTPNAVKIISETTGLTEAVILEEEKVPEPQN